MFHNLFSSKKLACNGSSTKERPASKSSWDWNSCERFNNREEWNTIWGQPNTEFTKPASITLKNWIFSDFITRTKLYLTCSTPQIVYNFHSFVDTNNRNWLQKQGHRPVFDGSIFVEQERSFGSLSRSDYVAGLYKVFLII